MGVLVITHPSELKSDFRFDTQQLNSSDASTYPGNALATLATHSLAALYIVIQFFLLLIEHEYTTLRIIARLLNKVLAEYVVVQ